MLKLKRYRRLNLILKQLTKTSFFIVFSIAIIILLLIIKHNTIQASNNINNNNKKHLNEYKTSNDDDNNNDFILNLKYNLYELNNNLYEINTEFKYKIDKMYKLVHLDLKGSPPKLNYLKNLIKYFKTININGILIEYEDMFPYDNNLKSISNSNAYKKEELKELFDLLIENQFLIIPLIQTYGHLEFILKLDEFKQLRESKQHFQVITPCLEDSYISVLFPMIDQILDMHPSNIEYIHIGCDEVYHVAKHLACQISSMKTTQDFFIK